MAVAVTFLVTRVYSVEEKMHQTSVALEIACRTIDQRNRFILKTKCISRKQTDSCIWRLGCPTMEQQIALNLRDSDEASWDPREDENHCRALCLSTEIMSISSGRIGIVRGFSQCEELWWAKCSSHSDARFIWILKTTQWLLPRSINYKESAEKLAVFTLTLGDEQRKTIRYSSSKTYSSYSTHLTFTVPHGSSTICRECSPWWWCSV